MDRYKITTGLYDRLKKPTSIKHSYMKKIFPESMPVPKGYYSPAVVHNGTVYVSGQLPINEKGEPQISSIEDEVRQCMKNIEIILKRTILH